MPCPSDAGPDETAGAADALQEIEASDEQSRQILADCLSTFSALRLRVSGDCMQPSLQPGDHVEIAPARLRRPRLGDIVLLRHPQGLRLHRLVFGPPRAWSFVRTKADRAAYWDPPVPRGDLLGVVVRAEPPRDRLTPMRRWLRVAASLARVLRRGPFSARGRAAARGECPSPLD